MTDLLTRFAAKTDRQHPPHFVGRQDVIQALTNDLQFRIEDWKEKSPDAWTSGTWLIQGAPGAGKTALLQELENRLPEHVQSNKTIRFCKLHTKDLDDTNAWQKKLGEALSPGAAKAMETMEQIQTGVKLGIPLAQAGTDVQEQAPVLTWSELLIQYRETPQNFHPVVLMIDEIQNTTGDKDSPATKTLQWLHEGTDQLPILPIYGGLAWSEEKLNELGISRLSDNGRVYTLPGLSLEECSQAVYAFLEKPAYQIQAKAEAKDWWAQQIAKECHGWPQHLHGSLRALAQELLADSVNRHLNQVESTKVAAKSRMARESYYEKRLSNSRLQNRPALAAIGTLLVQAGQTLKTPCCIAELGDALQHFSNWATQTGKKRYQLPEHTSGEQFAKQLIQAGLLHQEKEQLSVPIPSLIKYLQERYQAILSTEQIYQDTNTGPAPIQSLRQALEQLNRSSSTDNQ